MHSYLDDEEDESWLDTRPDPVAQKPRSVEPLWVVHISESPLGLARGLREGFICVGWVESGDLREFATKELLRAEFERTDPGGNPIKLANWVGDASRFVFEMNPGDLFVLPLKAPDDIHIGEVVGHYRFAADDQELVEADAGSQRQVKWLAKVPRVAFGPDARKCFDARHTVHSADGYRAEVLRVLEAANNRDGGSMSL